MAGTSRPLPISTRRERIAELASREPKMKLTTLAHHIDRTWLKEAWRRTRKDGAAGIDGVTASRYAENLDDKLGELEDRVKAGRWRAPPVRRAYIPKDDGKQRPLGIPTIEDKLLQRAFAMLLEPVFEVDFLDVSYGFRPGRSAHDALVRLRDGLWQMGGGWVLDVDLRSFFDTVDHQILRELVSERVGDGVVLRMIGKWLNAGVLEDGVVHRPGRGTPQGGVISPLLANVYLHHAVDMWFADEVTPRMRGSAFMIRYADDFVMAFSERSDAERVLDVLSKRLARFGLELNTEKTRLVYFGRPGKGPHDPDTFDFLGFTLHWGKARKGMQIIRWKTSKKRLNRTLRAFNDWMRSHRHWPVEQQQRALNRRLRGHYAYFGLSLNMRPMQQVYHRVTRLWRLWLDRRSQRGRMPWPRFGELLRRHPLARPRIVHRLFGNAQRSA
jgi:RNA-directed DNA polymerase